MSSQFGNDGPSDITTAKEIVDLTIAANEVIRVIRRNLPTPLESKDTRQVALGGIQKTLAAVSCWVNCLNQLGSVSLEELPSKLGMPSAPLDDVTKNMLNLLRNEVVLQTHFKVEKMFHNILIYFSHDVTRLRTYGKIEELILTYLEPDKAISISKVLKTWSSIRNSFHNNGIHNFDDFAFETREIRYEFRKDEPILCSSLISVLKLLPEYLECVNKILNETKISLIKVEIYDAYASLIDKY